MTFLKPTSTTLTLLLISLYSFGQVSTEFDYSKHSFSELDVLRMLKDSTYLGLSYTEITSMQPRDVWSFSQNSSFSLTEVLTAQSNARADKLAIETRLLNIEEKKIYDDIDRQLGIKK